MSTHGRFKNKIYDTIISLRIQSNKKMTTLSAIQFDISEGSTAKFTKESMQ